MTVGRDSLDPLPCNLCEEHVLWLSEPLTQDLCVFIQQYLVHI